MMSTTRFVALFLIASVVFAQHSGGSTAGFGAHPSATYGHVAGPRMGAVNTPRIRSAFGYGHRFGYGSRSGYGYFAPYLPLYGYDQTFGGYPEESPSDGNVFIFPPAGEAGPEPISAPPQSATAVIHEYKLNAEPAATPSKQTAFTIALKDGSMRSAVAFWVQSGKLHYIDSQDRQQVLSSDLIDRETTERLNREKNLTMQLPPI